MVKILHDGNFYAYMSADGQTIERITPYREDPNQVKMLNKNKRDIDPDFEEEKTPLEYVETIDGVPTPVHEYVYQYRHNALEVMKQKVDAPTDHLRSLEYSLVIQEAQEVVEKNLDPTETVNPDDYPLLLQDIGVEIDGRDGTEIADVFHAADYVLHRALTQKAGDAPLRGDRKAKKRQLDEAGDVSAAHDIYKSFRPIS